MFKHHLPRKRSKMMQCKETRRRRAKPTEEVGVRATTQLTPQCAFFIASLTLLLPDIRSGFNTGSFFRTADGLGVAKIYLAGFTPYPPHPEIAKTALGAEDFVPWEYHLDALSLVRDLQKQGVEIVALEKTFSSSSVYYYKPDCQEVCLICGNEVDGVPPALLALADKVVAIPMRGKKESFNVAVAGGIALAELAKFIDLGKR